MVLLRALLAGRWLIGAMVLPYVLIIARGVASGGWTGALALIATIMYAFTCLDSLILQRENDLRLSLVRKRGQVSDEALSIARVLFGAIACLLSLAMLLIQPWIGLTLLAVLVLIRVGIGTGEPSRATWLLRWIEWTLPVVSLILPLLLARGYGDQQLRDNVSHAFDPEAAQAASETLENGISTCSVLAVMLGASLLSASLLLCIIRDEHADRGAGIATTATALGRRGATLVLTCVAVFAGAVSMGGAAIECWNWGIPAIVFALAQLALWAILMHAERIAVPAWMIAGIVIGFMLLWA